MMKQQHSQKYNDAFTINDNMKIYNIGRITT